MPKRFTLFFSAPPYAGEHAATAARLAGAAPVFHISGDSREATNERNDNESPDNL
jgi:hypothetical protein